MSLFVVETHDDLFVGSVDFHEGFLAVRPGHRGHPKKVAQEDVVRLIPAEEHDDVVEV